jgi:hypothetical protein
MYELKTLLQNLFSIVKDNTKNEDKKEKNQEKYEDKYKNKLEQIEQRNLSNEELSNLKHSIIIENTPLGNVILFYNSEKESFIFFSDHVIPYRYLEVIARKYVITFNCKSIYIEMDKELNEAKERLETQKKVKEEQQQQRQQKQDNQLKPVYAQFKTNGVSKQTDIIVKEKSNRYTRMGNFKDYNILQPIDKKITDKNLEMSYSDFKRINLCTHITSIEQELCDTHIIKQPLRPVSFLEDPMYSHKMYSNEIPSFNDYINFNINYDENFKRIYYENENENENENEDFYNSKDNTSQKEEQYDLLESYPPSPIRTDENTEKLTEHLLLALEKIK